MAPLAGAKQYQQAATLSEPELAPRLRHLAASSFSRGHIVRGLEILGEVLEQAACAWRVVRGAPCWQ